MTLPDARTAIAAALNRMNALYTEPVFDEWVLVSTKPERGIILAYAGPRWGLCAPVPIGIVRRIFRCIRSNAF